MNVSIRLVMAQIEPVEQILADGARAVERDAVGVERAADQAQRVFRFPAGFAGDDVHRRAHRASAIEHRGRPAQDFDAIDIPGIVRKTGVPDIAQAFNAVIKHGHRLRAEAAHHIAVTAAARSRRRGHAGRMLDGINDIQITAQAHLLGGHRLHGRRRFQCADAQAAACAVFLTQAGRSRRSVGHGHFPQGSVGAFIRRGAALPMPQGKQADKRTGTDVSHRELPRLFHDDLQSEASVP